MSSIMNNIRIYCSGPLFCPEEVAGMQAISTILEQSGYTTFLPHRDGLEAYVLKFINTPLNTRILGIRDYIDRAIFALDIFQIVQCCHAIVVNLNGRIPDEGAIVEASIAYSCNKPVLFYKNDARAPFHGRDNAMILGLTSYPIITDINDIPKKVDGISTKSRQEKRCLHADAPFSSAVKLGAKIWTLIKPLGFMNKNNTQQMENLIQQIIQSCDEFSMRNNH